MFGRKASELPFVLSVLPIAVAACGLRVEGLSLTGEPPNLIVGESGSERVARAWVWPAESSTLAETERGPTR